MLAVNYDAGKQIDIGILVALTWCHNCKVIRFHMSEVILLEHEMVKVVS